MLEYPTPVAVQTFAKEVKRSRFITSVLPVIIIAGLRWRGVPMMFFSTTKVMMGNPKEPLGGRC